MSRLPLALALLALQLSCTKKTQQKAHSVTRKELLSREDRIFFTQATPHYADSLLQHASRAPFLRAIKRGWGTRVPFPNYSLTLANLASWIAAKGGRPLTSRSLSHVAAQFGITTPWIIQSFQEVQNPKDGELARWVREQLRTSLNTHEISHFGLHVQRGPRISRVVLLMQKRLLEVAPFSKWVPLGTPLVIFGKPNAPMSGLEVVVTHPKGKIERRFLVQHNDGSFKLSLQFCSKRREVGRYDMQFIGYTPEGPIHLAKFPVACTRSAWPKPKPPVHRVDAPKVVDSATFERRLFALVNNYREKLGYRPVAYHNTIYRAARTHSQEMCSDLKMVHISKKTGNPQERLTQAGLASFYLVSENIGVGVSPEAIFHGWVESADHRTNLQLAKVTHGAVAACNATLPNAATVYYVTLVMLNFRKAKGK